MGEYPVVLGWALWAIVMAIVQLVLCFVSSFTVLDTCRRVSAYTLYPVSSLFGQALSWSRCIESTGDHEDFTTGRAAGGRRRWRLTQMTSPGSQTSCEKMSQLRSKFLLFTQC